MQKSYLAPQSLSLSSSGFTLIELMIVILIIGILASLVAPKMLQRPEQARCIKLKYDLLMLKNTLALYKLDHGYYPATAAGLTALVTTTPMQANTYLDELPRDPWGNNYQYANSNGLITITSNGPLQKGACAATAQRQINFGA
mgnify:CR=1 FL=1